MKNKIIVLEPSTNTHTVEANHITAENLTESTIFLSINGKGVVSHGEHGTLSTESDFVIKIVQQEVNPVTKAIQNAYD
jgi:hypothetical protein